jgi:outer membrane assembly lipoprotein YfiO
MRRNAILLAALAVLGCAVLRASAAEPETWNYGGSGRWGRIERPKTQPSMAVPNAALDRVEAQLQARQSGPALKRVLAWLNSPANRNVPDRDRALFLLADAYYQEDDRIRAFYHLDELLDKHPESRFFYPSLEKQYRIADAFLKGHMRRFLGMPILPATDEAVDMLFRIQERAPGSPIAEKALLRTADYYFNTSQFDLSGDAYGAYARRYPRSPDVPRVRLRQAFSSYAQFRGVRWDATPLIDARAQLEDIKVRYPELAAEANVQKFIDNINATLARKLSHTADFYRRTGKARAAVYTYRELMSSYPDSREAKLAQGELRRMPESALRDPAPPKGRVAEPPVATQPSVGFPGPTTLPSVLPTDPRRPLP